MAQSTPEFSRGLLWLSGQTQPDGSLREAPGSIATPLQNAAESARTLKLFGTVPVVLIDSIAADDNTNTEYMARRIAALSAAGRDVSALLASLLARQNLDGGFGAAPEHESNALDTAFALAAIKSAGAGAEPAAKAITYLLQIQRADGGFAFNHDQASVYVTSLVSAALQPGSSDILLQSAFGHANAWLLSAQKADGSWGSIADTCLAQLAIAGTNSDSALHTLITASIIARQESDGSWAHDPYITALALRALAARPASAAATVGAISGVVVDGVSGAPLAGVSLTLAQVAGASTQSDGSGKFVFSSLASGSYTVTVSGAGFASREFVVKVNAGMTTEVTGLSLVAPASAGILQGVVRDGVTDALLAGASVSATGATTSSTMTQADGSYKFGGLAPGAVHVAIAKAGYLGNVLDGTIVAGAILEYSPRLQALGTSASLSGRVVDRIGGLPLAGVSVTVGTSGLSAVTGGDGRFVINGIGGGAASVTLSLADYAPKTFSFVSAPGVSVDAQTIMLDKSVTPSSTANLQGLVSDANSAEPIAGVSIVVTGSATRTATTGADGRFVLADMAPGAFQLKTDKDGYLGATGNAITVAGETLLFDVRLEQAVTPGVTGQVIDSVSLAPLPAVGATLDDKAMATDATGRFLFTGVAGGNHTLSLALPGYVTLRLPVAFSEGSLVDLKAIKLAKSSDLMLVAGRITDEKTGLGIPKATVTMLGTPFGALSDADGNFRIDQVPQGPATLRYSGVGYISETVIVALSPYDVAPHDRVLRAGQASSIALDLSTDQPHYAAYMPVAIKVQVDNQAATANLATVSVAILDEQGNYLDSFVATRTDAAGVTQSILSLAPGASTLDLAWNSMARPPGRYTALARILQVDAGAAAGAIEMAQRQTVFAIDPTEAIGSVRLTPMPAYTNLGSEEQLAYKVDVVNRSNVPVAGKLGYKLTTPAGTLVDSGLISLALQPAESSKSFVLSGPRYAFAASGLHPAALEALDGVAPALLEAGQVSVAPGTRIDATETVSPAQVVPDGDKRLHIEIRLQGIEQK